jgi:mannose-6-phosphate isomerase-like protein (cupin superfamily)
MPWNAVGTSVPRVGVFRRAGPSRSVQLPFGTFACVLYALTRESAEARHPPGDTVRICALFDDVNGCEKFAQRLLAFGAGSSRERVEPADDELLYVLEGSGVLESGGQRLAVSEGSGLFLRRGTPWSLSCARPVELLSVLVRSPAAGERPHALVDLSAEGRRSATAARQFTLGVRPELGCASATQFLGFIPKGRAPDHFHRYDEVIYILSGRGTLHIGGETAALAPGVCVHLPALLVHSLENHGPGELELLGVFAPAGSPAEAYYPDGTPAAYPEEG